MYTYEAQLLAWGPVCMIASGLLFGIIFGWLLRFIVDQLWNGIEQHSRLNALCSAERHLHDAKAALTEGKHSSVRLSWGHRENPITGINRLRWVVVERTDIADLHTGDPVYVKYRTFVGEQA